MKIEVLVVLTDCTQEQAESTSETIQEKIVDLPINAITIQFNQLLLYSNSQE